MKVKYIVSTIIETDFKPEYYKGTDIEGETNPFLLARWDWENDPSFFFENSDYELVNVEILDGD